MNRVFPRIILVGHSFGSGVALLEASQYGDVDGLILTGFLLNLHTNAATRFAIAREWSDRRFGPLDR